MLIAKFITEEKETKAYSEPCTTLNHSHYTAELPNVNNLKSILYNKTHIC